MSQMTNVNIWCLFEPELDSSFSSSQHSSWKSSSSIKTIYIYILGRLLILFLQQIQLWFSHFSWLSRASSQICISWFDSWLCQAVFRISGFSSWVVASYHLTSSSLHLAICFGLDFSCLCFSQILFKYGLTFLWLLTLLIII